MSAPPALEMLMQYVDENRSELGDHSRQIMDLTMAVRNELPSAPPQTPPAATFVRIHQPLIQSEMNQLRTGPELLLRGTGSEEGYHVGRKRSFLISVQNEGDIAGIHHTAGEFLEYKRARRTALATCDRRNYAPDDDFFECGKFLVEGQSKLGWLRRMHSGDRFCSKACASDAEVKGPLVPL